MNSRCPKKKGETIGTLHGLRTLEKDCPGRLWVIVPGSGEYACDECQSEFYGNTAKEAIENYRRNYQ